MNPKRKHKRKLFDPSNGEISLPKVITLIPNPQENLTTKTLNPQENLTTMYSQVSLSKPHKNLKNEALYSVQENAASCHVSSHRATMEQITIQYYTLSDRIVPCSSCIMPRFFQ